MNKVSAVVLTKDSSSTLKKCLDSLEFVNEIIIVDDYSADNTQEIAGEYTQKVFKRHLEGDFSRQRNYGLGLASNDWVVFVDSDEVVTKELSEEIVSLIEGDTDHDGFYIRREDVMWGKTLKHGDSNVLLLRLGRKEKGKWVGKVHETWKMKGKIGNLKGSLTHFPHPTIAEFLGEVNFYSTVRAKELFEQKTQVNWYSVVVYPKVKFLQIYFVKLGVLDGIEGLLSALMMSFYSFLVRAKLWQMYGKEKG